jgi:MscS family membrane protein
MATTTVFGLSGDVAALVVFIIGLVTAFVIYGLVRWLKKKAEATENVLDDIIIAAFGTPVVIGVIVVSAYYALQVADLPESWQFVLDSKYLDVVWIILGGWIVGTFLHNALVAYGHRLTSLTESDIDDRMVAFAEIAAKYVVWFIVFLLILNVLEIDITPLLAGAGIVTLAIAFAAQDIFANFMGGAVIAMDKPFKVNDRVKIDEYFGDVSCVGTRSTRIRTLDNQIVIVPNKKMLDSYVVNYAQPDSRMKVRIPIGVAYGTNVNRVKEILLEIAREQAHEVPYILTDPAPLVYFLEFGASSLNFQMIVWTNDFSLTLEVQDLINTRIAERFGQEGIEIPFPQMDVHLKDDLKRL